MSEKHRRKISETYISLIVLLLAGFLLFAGYSFTGDDGGAGLVKTRIAGYLRGASAGPVSSVTVIEDTEPEKSRENVQDTVPKHILLLGDSMVEGLSKPFGRYAAVNGHELTSVIWYSSSSKTWALTDTLEYFVRKYNPDFVMVSLGGNELFVRDLENRKRYVSDIVERLSGIPFIWIGPPNWKDDTGINSILCNIVGHDRFFESCNLEFERGADGRHPTARSSSVWADTISSWLMNTSCHRIRMERPEGTVAPKVKVIVLSNARI